MPLTQLQILERARPLASNLATGSTPVKKNAFFSVVADFMSDPKADLSRLGRLLDLLGKGQGGHLKRGEGYGDQVRTVVQVLGPFLQQHDDVAPEDWKSIFGWTARLLTVREAPGRDRGHDRPPQARRHDPTRDPRREQQPRKPKADKFGGLGGKSQDVLKAFKERLAGKEEEKE